MSGNIELNPDPRPKLTINYSFQFIICFLINSSLITRSFQKISYLVVYLRFTNFGIVGLKKRCANSEILINVVNLQILECSMVRVARPCNSECVGFCVYYKNS